LTFSILDVSQANGWRKRHTVGTILQHTQSMFVDCFVVNPVVQAFARGRVSEIWKQKPVQESFPPRHKKGVISAVDFPTRNVKILNSKQR
jgi:hypothetical protein